MAKAKDDSLGIAPPVDSDEHKRILSRALARIDEAEQLHRQLVPSWIDNYREFRAMASKSQKRKLSWQTALRHPYIGEQVMALVPRYAESMAEWEVTPGLGVDREVARKQQRALNYWTGRDGIPHKSTVVALYQMLFGVTWTTTGFDYRSVQRRVVDRNTGKPHLLDVVTRNQPTMQVGHPLDVMWDPRATFFENLRYVTVRTLTTKRQLRALERRVVKDEDGTVTYRGRYENTKDVHGLGELRRGEVDAFPNAPELPAHVNARAGGDESVELLTVYDRERDELITVANRQVVVRHQNPMPWWHGDIPVSCAVTSPDVGVLHGIPDVEWMAPIQRMLHEIEQSQLDNTRLQMDFILLVRDTVEDLNALELAPGAKWPVEDPSDIQALQYPQPQMMADSAIEQLRGRLQAIAGTGYMTGSDPGAMGMSQDTASGLMSIIEQGNIKIDHRAALLRQMWDRIGSQWVSLGGQYLEDSLILPSAQGEDPVPVQPAEMAQETFVTARMDSRPGLESLRQARFGQIAQAAQMLIGTPIPTAEGMKSFSLEPIVDELADLLKRPSEDFLHREEQAAPAAPGPMDQVLAAQPGGGVMMPGMPGQ